MQRPPSPSTHYQINNNFNKINLAFQADLGKSAGKR